MNWNEGKAIQSGTTELVDATYRTTCDMVAIPESGLTVTVTDDDLELCIFVYSVSYKQVSGMSCYTQERTKTYGYGEINSRYVRIMVRSISNPNSVAVTAERAAAGVHFTAI